MGFAQESVQEVSQMPLMALNHVSFVVRSVSRSVKFYEKVLGFASVKRPSSFSFEGAWLFNYGLGIHLLESTTPEQLPQRKGAINPKDNHISFQCSDMGLLARKLEAMGVEYVTAVVEEGGVTVDQLFFHDPDGYMVEICNCHVLPVLPLSSACPLRKPLPAGGGGATDVDASADAVDATDAAVRSPACAVEVEKKMMETLVAEIMGISF
ncbi:hypothetical protein Taro_011825 [Colocasia esculenta]|uniref:VOC domain-containing protein n=1 Tax=Colocasia esculenta TaxID=4460 RepID=A0A843UB78_COLES|nr:hypothetical protein [Colocasia esculenta]